jgi:hypothetical protein
MKAIILFLYYKCLSIILHGFSDLRKWKKCYWCSLEKNLRQKLIFMTRNNLKRKVYNNNYRLKDVKSFMAKIKKELKPIETVVPPYT